jgi:hypothetical protein
MTRRWPRPVRPSRRRRPARGGYDRRASSSFGWLLLLAAVVALAWWQWPRIRQIVRRPVPKAVSQSPAGLKALTDSVDAATRRKDWVGALHWAKAAAENGPRHPLVMRNFAAAWHNYAVGNVRGIPLQRTSLDRMRCEALSFAAAESAMSLATNDDEWNAAAMVHGNNLAYLGFPNEALATYMHVLERRQEGAAANSADFLRDRLRNPLLADPAEPQP